MNLHLFILIKIALLQGGRAVSALRGSCVERTRRRPSKWQTARRAPSLVLPCFMVHTDYVGPQYKLCRMQTLGGRTVVADWAVPKAQYIAAAAPPPGMSHSALPAIIYAAARSVRDQW